MIEERTTRSSPYNCETPDLEIDTEKSEFWCEWKGMLTIFSKTS